MSGSFQSVRWNACVHRLDPGLYSHPKSCWGMKSEPMLTQGEKSSLPEKKVSSEKDQTHDAALSRTESSTHYQRAIPDPTDALNPNDSKSAYVVDTRLASVSYVKYVRVSCVEHVNHLPTHRLVGLVESGRSRVRIPLARGYFRGRVIPVT